MTKLIRVIAIVVLALTAFGGSVAAYEGSRKDVTVIDGDVSTTYDTRTETVEQLFEDKEITVNTGDEVNKSFKYYLNDGDTIIIDRATKVVLNIDNVPRMVRTRATTVAELLKEMSKDIGKDYKLKNVKETDEINEDMVIMLSVAKEVIKSTVADVDFKTETVKDGNMNIGEKVVTQAGVKGKTKTTYKEIILDDEVIKTETIGTTVVEKPVNEIVKVGTKIAAGAVIDNIDIASLNITSKMTVSATGYTRFDAGCTDYTYSGTLAKRGVIAVDPKVIPLGTKVYVPGYGVAVAEDIGGAIKGSKIDLCYDTVNEAFQWGRRTVEIYILG